MNLLMFSWRDIKHPFKGGAEIYTYEILKRLVKKGHKVTWFGSAYNGCKSQEIVNGINIIRQGSFLSVYWKAYQFYNKEFKGNFDLVIDQINTIPFFTPFYVKEKRLSLIFQLARSVWFSELHFPLSLFGYLLESVYLCIYKNQKTVTISNSSRNDLKLLGFKDITVIPVGLSFESLKQVPKKNNDFTVLFVGRLKKSKRVYDVIKAFNKVVKKNKKVREAVRLKVQVFGIPGQNSPYFEKFRYTMGMMGIKISGRDVKRPPQTIKKPRLWGVFGSKEVEVESTFYDKVWNIPSKEEILAQLS